MTPLYIFDLDGTLIGQYQIRYEDGLIEVIPIVYGEDVRDWWNWDKSTPVKRGKEILRGETPDSKLRDIGVRLYLSTWQNPRPRIRVESITFVSVFDAVASPFCVAMTTQQSMEPSPEDGSYASKPGRRKTNWSNRESVGQ